MYHCVCCVTLIFTASVASSSFSYSICAVVMLNTHTHTHTHARTHARTYAHAHKSERGCALLQCQTQTTCTSVLAICSPVVKRQVFAAVMSISNAAHAYKQLSTQICPGDQPKAVLHRGVKAFGPRQYDYGVEAVASVDEILYAGYTSHNPQLPN